MTQLNEELNTLLYDWTHSDDVVRELRELLVPFIKSQNTQLLNDISSKVIGEDESNEDEVLNDLFYAIRNGLRVQQRTILESIKEEMSNE